KLGTFQFGSSHVTLVADNTEPGTLAATGYDDDGVQCQRWDVVREGIFVGYRYYDAKEVTPLFPFGHGLSYTEFAYSDLQVTPTVKRGEPVAVSVTVKNVGERAGKEVVQLYVRDVQARLPRPPKELKRFAKISLAPGEAQTVRFELDERALAFYDPDSKAWVAEPGEFEVLIGSSSRDIRARATFKLED
ncbi:MAG: metallopeptidase TldD-related protein, partial [Anaerolineae bacterium]